jgi:hypothetical protein
MGKGDGWTVESQNNDVLETLAPKKKWWDGGLAVMFPKVDNSTILVSPVAIRSKSNIVISPKWIGDDPGIPIGTNGLLANKTMEVRPAVTTANRVHAIHRRSNYAN